MCHLVVRSLRGKKENLTKETKKKQPEIEEGTEESENEGRFEKY